MCPLLSHIQACYIGGLACKLGGHGEQQEDLNGALFAFNNIPWRSQCTSSQLLRDVQITGKGAD
jgi:hypothetical protein